MGLPVPPTTPTTTVRGCAVVMLEEDGVTVMVGATTAFVTVIVAVPVADL